MKDYYAILEILPDASPKQMREQYHFLVHAWHPDKFPNPDQKAKAQEKTKEINEAYEVLRNPAKRAEYDKERLTRSTTENNSSSAHASGQHGQESNSSYEQATTQKKNNPAHKHNQIVECKDCKGMVSTSAELCPHCGASYPTSYIPAKVIVSRKFAMVGLAVKMSIFIDGTKVGSIWSGETMNFDVAPGIHLLEAKGFLASGSDWIKIKVTSARTHMFEVGWGFHGPRFE
jgi:DnaJ-class molecular chaperone